MSDGLLGEVITSVEHLVATAVREMFGGGAGGSSMDAVRWEGMSNDQLAAAVRQLNSGPGTTGIQQAADALSTIAADLQQIEQTLHTQLQAIGVNWQSAASGLAQEMTTEAAAYTSSASGASSAASAAVNAQGDAFAAARNAVPQPSALTATTAAQPTSFALAAGAILTGHSQDHVQTVARSNQARQQTIDTLNTYTTNSQAGLSSHQPLPQPPTINLRPAPVTSSAGNQVTTVAGYVPPPPTVAGGSVGTVPGAPAVGGAGGAGGLPGLPSVGTPTAPGLPGLSSGLPGSPGLPGVTPGLPGLPATGGGTVGQPGVPVTGIPGTGAPATGMPGTGGAPGTGGLPGTGGGTGGVPGVTPRVPGAAGTPLAPGPVSGIGSPAAPTSGISAAQTAAAGSAVSGSIVEDAAVGSAIVGGTVGAGVGGASAKKDELVRSRDLVGEQPPPESTDARSHAARALAELEGEEAAKAGVSARIGATAEPPPTLLEPAVAGRRDEDEKHSNRYAADDEMFGDGRMVVPPVLDGGDQGDFGPLGTK